MNPLVFTGIIHFATHYYNKALAFPLSGEKNASDPSKVEVRDPFHTLDGSVGKTMG